MLSTGKSTTFASAFRYPVVGESKLIHATPIRNGGTYAGVRMMASKKRDAGTSMRIVAIANGTPMINARTVLAAAMPAVVETRLQKDPVAIKLMLPRVHVEGSPGALLLNAPYRMKHPGITSRTPSTINDAIWLPLPARDRLARRTSPSLEVMRGAISAWTVVISPALTCISPHHFIY